MTYKEIWKPVPGDDYLEVSSWGRVRSRPYETPMPRGGTKTNQLKPTKGYLANGNRPNVRFRRKNYRISRLVCMAFHGPPPFDGAVAMHLDEDPTNNRPSNLRWGTQKENLNFPGVKAYHRRVCREKMTSQPT